MVNLKDGFDLHYDNSKKLTYRKALRIFLECKEGKKPCPPEVEDVVLQRLRQDLDIMENRLSDCTTKAPRDSYKKFVLEMEAMMKDNPSHHDSQGLLNQWIMKLYIDGLTCSEIAVLANQALSESVHTENSIQKRVSRFRKEIKAYHMLPDEEKIEPLDGSIHNLFLNKVK